MIKQITSTQNPYIKSLILLQEKSKYRKETKTFLIEGKREIELAIKGNYTIETILFVPEFVSLSQIKDSVPNHVNSIEISKEVYQKIAYRDTTEGIVAVAKTKTHELENLELPSNPLIIVLEALEKPGNIGAILRTCDAAKIDAVIIANPKTDLYNPNIVRSSVGCLFTNQIITGSTQDILKYLQQKNIQLFAATLQNATSYHTQNYTKPSAIIVGTEATGLSKEWRTNEIQPIIIPMQGEIDSMNVSVATAILVFEAKRQRGF